MHMAPLFAHRRNRSNLHLSSLPQAKLSCLCFFTTRVHLWRKRGQKGSLFHKIGQFSFGVKSGNVTRKFFFLGGRQKVLGISCFFADNEFRKYDLPHQGFLKKCLPTLLFSNPNWYDNIQEVNIWKWVLKKETTHTQKKLFSFLVNVILNFKVRI